MFESSFLFASLIWGSVGVGYFIYGKKQSSLWPMLGGIALVCISYFISSALLMSLAAVAIIFATHWLLRR